jgi:hypothetical protein
MDDLDLAAAQLRADGADLPAFVEALAVRLEGALPRLVTVERRRAGFLSGRREVARIACRLGDETFTLAQDGAQLTTRREKTVRGITLKTDELPVDRWVAELITAVAGSAQAGEDQSRALRELLS